MGFFDDMLIWALSRFWIFLLTGIGSALSCLHLGQELCFFFS